MCNKLCLEHYKWKLFYKTQLDEKTEIGVCNNTLKIYTVISDGWNFSEVIQMLMNLVKSFIWEMSGPVFVFLLCQLPISLGWENPFMN